jgi:signal transduction histidine kinase
MANLIQSLLEFSRLVNASTLMETVDLNAVVAAVINDFELAISEKGAEIHRGELPVIEGIALQLNQLFYNLIGNAIKFSEPDRPPVIEIHAESISSEEVLKYIQTPLPDTSYYRISIVDNGIGFDARYVDQIFEIFKRLHTRDAYPGSGIGLALCRRIVTNHNGHMIAMSTPGEGSTFQLILPERQ